MERKFARYILLESRCDREGVCLVEPKCDKQKVIKVGQTFYWAGSEEPFYFGAIRVVDIAQ